MPDIEKTGSLTISYPVSDQIIDTLAGRMNGLADQPITSTAAYDVVRTGIAECRQLRGAVEKTRVQLKADSLEFGRAVDREAKRLTARVEAIEGPLKVAKQKVDDEKERVIREAAEKERLAREAEEKAKRDAEEARLRAIRLEQERELAEQRERLEREAEALAARIAAEVEAHRQEILAEQRKQDAERKQLEAHERLIAHERRVEQEKFERERRELAAERDRLQRLEFERQARDKAEKDAAERAERLRIEEEKRQAIQADLARRAETQRLADEASAEAARDEAERAEAKRIEDERPDLEKIREFGKRLRTISLPELKTKPGVDFITKMVAELHTISHTCEHLKRLYERKAAKPAEPAFPE